MSDLPVAVRVKRRRECAAPAEIILETSSRPQDALAASLKQRLAVVHNNDGVTGASEGPPKKRCRFVLVPGRAAADSHATAGVQERQGPAGPILELWHTSGLFVSAATAAAAATDGGRAAQSPTPGPWGPQPASEADGEARAEVYAAMVQQYLQEQQHSTSAHRTQQHTPRRPFRRVQRSNSSHASRGPVSVHPAPQEQQQGQHQQQEQLQQERVLPTYMTKGMLKQYGLWQGQHTHQQDCTAPPAGRSTAVASHAPDSTDDGMECAYTFDVYVAAEAGVSSAGAAGPCASTGADAVDGQQNVADTCPSTPDAVGPAAADLPVIQVWEDELLQLHQDWALGQTATAEVDSEDSNAEDYYANDYPDEDDASFQDSMDSSDAEDERSAPGRSNGATAGIGIYQPGSSGKGWHGRARAENELGAGGYASDGSFDADEYESSAGQEDGVREEMGGAWLHKYCTGYGVDEGGQAWRSVLAQQFAPDAPR